MGERLEEKDYDGIKPNLSYPFVVFLYETLLVFFIWMK